MEAEGGAVFVADADFFGDAGGELLPASDGAPLASWTVGFDPGAELAVRQILGNALDEETCL